jgi:hypothetical protein
MVAEERTGAEKGEKGIMKEPNEHLKALYQSLEKMIARYHLLIEEMKKESEYLKQGSQEALMQVVYSIGIQTSAIQRDNDIIGQMIEKILKSSGQEGKENTLSSMLAVLPSREQGKIKSYQKTLVQLKEWIAQRNSHHKWFIQESLQYCRDLFSLLTEPVVESPVYVQSGLKKAAAQLPYSLNRKV